MNQIPIEQCEQSPHFESAARACYSGKRILVTGAAGSIGSRLIIKLSRLAPTSIVALDKDENGIYELDQELRLRRMSVPVEPHVADIRDTCRLESLCQAYAPQVIFHAAAYKNVPLMELHPSEAILGNVMGTKNLLDVVAGFGAERFVFISTDEAGNPINVMGATKRIGEMLVQSASQSGRVQAASVRFGNVLGSRGSIVPLFQKQINAGGPLTLTHPGATRYFISMQQAVQFILAAGCVGQKGEIFVAETGRLRNIEEFAREMILLAGLEPGKELEIRTVGLRPGECLTEDRAPRSQRVKKTRFEGLSVLESSEIDDRALMRNFSHLVQAARSADPRGIHSILERMGIGYKRIVHPPPPESRLPSPHKTGGPLEAEQSPSPGCSAGNGAAT